MSALAHFIERHGVATTTISLIREQTEKVAPPRALWVPYALGRPLGSADDPQFQRDVMSAAFDLLYTTSEPTIVDYPIEAPEEAGPGQWSCPVSFAADQDDTFAARLQAEVARLRPWAEETRRDRGRTFFGASGATIEQVDAVAAAVAHVADSGDVLSAPPSEVAWTSSMPLLIRHLADDLRTFYHEAVAAQPGPGAPNHQALTDWIFSGTALGDAFQAIAQHLSTVEEVPMTLLVRGFLIPEGHFEGGSAFPPNNPSIDPET